jgi:brefeldin A-resistance guanine nucleotide exchange factor 1
LSGYGNCAAVAAYYGMTDVFDNLIIHLCKFSTLMGSFDLTDSSNSKAKDHQQLDSGYSSKTSVSEHPDQAVYAFAQNYKAQISTQLMFQLIRKHGDNLRAGWKNVIDCVLQLFRMQVLPPCLTMVEDYVDPRCIISIYRPKIK